MGAVHLVLALPSMGLLVVILTLTRLVYFAHDLGAWRHVGAADGLRLVRCEVWCRLYRANSDYLTKLYEEEILHSVSEGQTKEGGYQSVTKLI